VGSLAGAANLLKDNVGVLAHREQKSLVEQKGLMEGYHNSN
jgi:hypothetical protein